MGVTYWNQLYLQASLSSLLTLTTCASPCYCVPHTNGRSHQVAAKTLVYALDLKSIRDILVGVQQGAWPAKGVGTSRLLLVGFEGFLNFLKPPLT
jgi:hypothetical protein